MSDCADTNFLQVKLLINSLCRVRLKSGLTFKNILGIIKQRTVAVILLLFSYILLLKKDLKKY
jgi:hypothetical protein